MQKLPVVLILFLDLLTSNSPKFTIFCPVHILKDDSVPSELQYDRSAKLEVSIDDQ